MHCEMSKLCVSPSSSNCNDCDLKLKHVTERKILYSTSSVITDVTEEWQ